jgi:hypothetical protein
LLVFLSFLLSLLPSLVALAFNTLRLTLLTYSTYSTYLPDENERVGIQYKTWHWNDFSGVHLLRDIRHSIEGRKQGTHVIGPCLMFISIHL